MSQHASASPRSAETPQKLEPIALQADGSLSAWLPDEVAQAEAGYIDAWREKNVRSRDRDALPLTGLALSGGGIRSATFCLGVLQRLVRARILERFDYLSTVSGGGYIGASLAFFARKHGAGCDPATFPYGLGPQSVDGHRDSREQRALLQYLRQRGRYLTPDSRMTLAAGAAAVLRAMFSNLVVWLPLLAALMMVMQLRLADVFDGPAATCQSPKHDLAAVLALSVQTGVLRCATLFTAALWIALLVTGLAVVVAVLYSIGTRFERHQERWLARFGGLATVRRRYEVVGGRLLVIVIGAAVLASVPIVYDLLEGWVEEIAPSALVAGVASGLWSLLSGGAGASRLSRVLIPVGAILVLYATLLIAYLLALPTDDLSWPRWWLWLAVLLVVGGGLGWFVNINILGLHRFYRDRLMEAFMPNLRTDPADQVRRPEGSAATEADRTYLSGAAALHAAMPYHLVNTNVVLLNSDVPARHERMGDSFCLSPHWCGGSAVGWQATGSFLEGKLTLPTAMAVSGAAANPNATALADPFVGLLASLLNIRLGIWVSTPNPTIFGRTAPATHFHAAWHELAKLLGASYHERCGFLQLSDGGHFENLGIYELVRRRVPVIVAIDATADPGYEYADLFRALRLIEEDFGVKPAPTPDIAVLLAPLMRDAKRPAGYPPERTLSDRCWFACKLVGPDGYRAELMYLTTTLTRAMPWRSRGYWTGSEDFPDETTADQFFDPDQFEAYRLLGYHAADEALAARLGEQPGGETLEQRLKRM